MNTQTIVNRIIFFGFISAGLTNILGILTVSQLFTNESFHQLSPDVFSQFGAFMIMVWGLAYLAAAKHASNLAALCFVFAFEKAVYVFTWAVWMMDKSELLSMVKLEEPVVAMFYSGYGVIDLVYALFFTWVGVRALRN